MDQEGLVVKKRLPTVMLEVGAGGEEASLVPGETTSEVMDPVEAWLLSSPCSERPAAGTGAVAVTELAGDDGMVVDKVGVTRSFEGAGGRAAGAAAGWV
jgi:hypothetical protein